MHFKTGFLLILCFTVVLGCKRMQPETASQVQVKVHDSIGSPMPPVDSIVMMKANAVLQVERDQKRKKDSIAQALFLKSILDTAAGYTNKNNFFKEIAETSQFPGMKAKITIGHLFSKNKRHLIVRRGYDDNGIVIDIYLLKNGSFDPILEKPVESLNFIKDTIQDINGDGNKDFVIEWHPSSGCCRADISTVFLYNPQNGKFGPEVEFENATFSPREHVIRGVNYGHPGEAGLYKYKWNGLKYDTVEHIYPNIHNREQFYKTKGYQGIFNDKAVALLRQSKEIKILKHLPAEYRKIKNLDWFEDY